MTETSTGKLYPEAPIGIGGWLVLPAIGLVLAPISILVMMITDLLPAFESDAWRMLTTPGSSVYHPWMGPLLIFEVVGNIALVVFAVVLLYFFSTKSRRLPRLIIIWLLVNLVVVGIDTFWSMQIPLIASDVDASFFKEFARTVIAAGIWIPYFNMSKRVKNTFTQ